MLIADIILMPNLSLNPNGGSGPPVRKIDT